MKILLNAIAGIFRIIGTLLKVWPLVLIIAFILSPIGPHIRWQYKYTGTYSNKTYFISCDYMGSRGLVLGVPHAPPECPLILILDTRSYAR